MNIAVTEPGEYRREDVLSLWDALKPEGMLSWNPKVAKFPWGLVADNQEKSKVSEDLEGDEVVHKGFSDVFRLL